MLVGSSLMSDLVQKQVEWVKAVGAAGGKSVDALLQQARPPRWKFWVGEVDRAAAVQVLAAKAKADDRLLPCFFEVLGKDSSPKIRQAAVQFYWLLAIMIGSILVPFLRDLVRHAI